MARNAKKPDSRVLVAAGAVAASAAAAGTATRVRARRRAEARRYRLGKDEPVTQGVRRIAHGQLELVAEQLHGDPGDEGIHEARKAFKRLRALLRLTRDQLGTDVRRRENAAFRDAGRRLSGARDARVLVETLDDLIARNRDALQPGTFDGLRSALAAGAESDTDVGAVLAAVDVAQARVEIWPLGEDDSMAALAPGLKRIYRRGRRAFRAAEAEPSSEHLHELRKRTKDLWHAAQILRPAAPKRLRKLGRKAHKLSDVLGDDHDLVTLLEAARERPAALTPVERELLEGLVDRRRSELRREGLKRAGKLYAARPRKVARLVI
jgi:CHAD domain-containing protein